MPEELDQLQRQKLRLQVEETALSKEKDAQSQERLGEVRKELAALEERLQPLLVRWVPSGLAAAAWSPVAVQARSVRATCLPARSRAWRPH